MVNTNIQINGNVVINNIREMIREDATPEMYEELLSSIDFITTYERRSKQIVKKWEAEAERRKAIEDQLPKVSPEVLGRLAYENFKQNVQALRKDGII